MSDMCRDAWGCDGWCRCQPNPYRFTVEPRKYGDDLWCVELVDRGSIVHAWLGLFSEAEANEHAELIRQAMREVS